MQFCQKSNVCQKKTGSRHSWFQHGNHAIHATIMSVRFMEYTPMNASAQELMFGQNMI
jgi:hypothetical protein